MYSLNYDKKIFTDTTLVWIVFIYSDLSSQYENVIDVPKDKMSIHEFDNKNSLNEYLYVIDSINDEKINVQFHYLIIEQNINLSTKYTNRVQELNF